MSTAEEVVSKFEKHSTTLLSKFTATSNAECETLATRASELVVKANAAVYQFDTD